MEKIKSFTSLKAWQEGHKFVLSIYQITNTFPKTEMFGLTSQLRRAAVSITSNIAEGFGRKSQKEKTQFYRIALASLTETQNQILIAKDVHYIQKDDFDVLAEQTVTVAKLINGLLRSIQSRTTSY
ncbi:MAG: four helix bundle protein [Candidatus Peribacteraceae bacterium]|jgi:four helix bundle protein|nr:hypothetical protein [bacterium]MAE68823.1 hypothetical protein [bacterium]MDP6561874.1 four helix bundle protein [Candidatus Peribacteraceae bacterium]|tara:strand:- start:1349 stop:1726 length:378 start_codon:yes stop_codon:yes gene_type:complete